MQGPQLPALEQLRGQRLDLEGEEGPGTVSMHGSDPRASGPKVSLPPSPSTSTFSEAHFGLLGLQHQHTWAKVWLTWHLYFRSQLYGHFLQEAFPGLLSNLWHPCTPKSITLPLVKLLITDTQGPWVREGRTGPTLFPDVSSTWHPMKEITLASYQQLRPPPPPRAHWEPEQFMKAC